MNAISLVLFGEADRYWHSLPAAVIAFTELYPGFDICLHHSTDALAHPLFPFVQELAARLGRFRLVHVERGYVGTEPTLWRMLPLWEPDVELWFCRDVDSLPTIEELRAIRVFAADGSPPIHGIRGYRLHNGLLLAGLCGFKNQHLDFLRHEIGSFDHYWHIYRRLGLHGRWGCDQQMLAVGLGRHAVSILDSRFGDAPALDLPVVTVPSEVYGLVSLDDLPADLLQVCDQVSSFVGQPQDDTRSAFRKMLALDLPSAAVVRESLGTFRDVERRLTG